MKKIIVLVSAILMALILSLECTIQSYAMSNSQSEAIQSLLDEASKTSGVPGMSVSILEGESTHYFASGYADRKEGLHASEDSLYELASVSKAFTGLGILLLEEQGLLSMSDSVQKYLPWFTLTYEGKSIEMNRVTLDNFLHHTSGLTNRKHIQKIPQGNSPDMLQKTVEVLADSELEFLPGEKYSYGTVNYDILGLIIERVSGQSYEEFMTEQVFQPLGLHHTYVYKDKAKATGELAQGYRSSFMTTTAYDAPDYAGNKPAGYIISCTTDMARWMSIQMGMVKDIPEDIKSAVKKSHEPDISVSDVDGMFYAGGWTVNNNQTIIEHAGGNPNFATEVVIFPKEKRAICLLTNGANTNIGLVKNINEILDGDLEQSYKVSANQLLDIFLSTVTILEVLLTILFICMGLRRKQMKVKGPVRNSKKTIAWFIVTVVICLLSWLFPWFTGYTWETVLVWQTYSLLTVLIALCLLSASITWFIYADRYIS
jgi:CubicO group peptidase (beta-lactamase class C family)